MATLRQVSAEQTRAGILKVSRDLFLSQGYQGTSTRAIADSCQITQPNLYHHFGNKQQLFVKVIEDLVEEVEAAQREVLSLPISSEEKLVAMVHVLLAKHPANFFRMMADIKNYGSNDNPQALYQMYQKAYIAPLEEVFSTLTLRSGVSVEDATTHLMYHLGALMSLSNVYNKEQTAEQLTKTMDLLLYGVVENDAGK